jgi:hypothetical protein
MSTLSDMVHAIVVAWSEGLRWRFQVRFDGPTVESCRHCAGGHKCDASR